MAAKKRATKKQAHGGVRDGAGRPPRWKGGARTSLTLRLYQADSERIEELRPLLGMTKASKSDVVRRAVVVLYDDLQRPAPKPATELSRAERMKAMEALYFARGYVARAGELGDLARKVRPVIEMLLDKLGRLDG